MPAGAGDDEVGIVIVNGHVGALTQNVNTGAGDDDVAMLFLDSAVDTLTQKVNTGAGNDDFGDMIANSQFSTLSREVDVGDGNDLAAVIDAAVLDGQSLGQFMPGQIGHFRHLKAFADMAERLRGADSLLRGDLMHTHFLGGSGDDAGWLRPLSQWIVVSAGQLIEARPICSGSRRQNIQSVSCRSKPSAPGSGLLISQQLVALRSRILNRFLETPSNDPWMTQAVTNRRSVDGCRWPAV